MIKVPRNPAFVPAAAMLLVLLAPAPARAQDVEHGQELFQELKCASCHGYRAQGQLGPTLAATDLSLAAVRAQVRAPTGRRMPEFPEDKLPEQDLLDIYAYLRGLEPPTLNSKSTWWGIELLNLPTPATTPAGELQIHFSHRFSDSIQDAGRERLYGLDSFAFPGFWFTYGATDRIAPYFGRTSNLATWELGLKVGLLREGDLGIPVSAALNVGGTFLDADGIDNNTRFTAELPIGVRLGSRFAVQVVPMFSTDPDEDDLPDSASYATALGFGGSLKLSRTYSLDGEWITHLSGFRREGAIDQWQAGVTIHITKHMFQLLVSDSILTTPDFMVGGTRRTGVKSNVRLGFNLVRAF